MSTVESDSTRMDDQGSCEALKQSKSAFTFRSIGFGAIGLLFTIFYTAINDLMFKQTPFIANHLAPGPIFLVICIAVLWNPVWSKRAVLGIMSAFLLIFWGAYWSSVWGHSFLLSWHCLFIIGIIISFKSSWFQRASKAFLLSGRELIVVLLIIFAGCWTAGASLNYHLPTTLVNVWSVYANSPQMQDVKTLEYIPEHLSPAGGLNAIADNLDERVRVYDSFATGSEMQNKTGVPWDAWLGPVLSGWAPLFILVAMCLVSMSFMVHRQWAHHEQLAYPIAKIGSSLLEREGGRALPSIFYNNLFRIAAITVLVFHGIRYMHVWWPSNVPDIPTTAWFTFILDIFPVLKQSGLFYAHYFSFYFCIIGISYFLPREVGLSLGIVPFVLAIAGAQVYMATGSTLGGSDISGMRVGAYLVYAVIILYTGRHYYYPLLKRAFFLKPDSEHEENAVLAARLFFVSFVSLILVLRFSFDLDIDLAFLFTVITMLMFLVFTRIICETGIPYLQSNWETSGVMIKLFGVSSLGAAPIVILYYISSVLLSDPKESLMPYVSNGIKMGEDNKIKTRRIFGMFIGIAVLAVFLSIGVRLYQQYSIGGHALSYPWADTSVPTGMLKKSTRALVELDSVGEPTSPDSNERVGILSRIGNISPDGNLVKFMILGGLGVMLFSFLRIRYTWFPLHPVFFLVLGIAPLYRTFYSFLIGWLIRELIVKYGGGKVYQQLKPLFIGLIVGELSMMGISIVMSLIVYLFTGEPGPAFYFNFG